MVKELVNHFILPYHRSCNHSCCRPDKLRSVCFDFVKGAIGKKNP